MTGEPQGEAPRMVRTCEAAFGVWDVARPGSEYAANFSSPEINTGPAAEPIVDSRASDSHLVLLPLAGWRPRVFPGL